MTAQLTGAAKRALKLLAGKREGEGIGEDLFVDGYGFSRELVAGLVGRGLAEIYHAEVMAGGVPIYMVKLRITHAGRLALAKAPS